MDEDVDNLEALGPYEQWMLDFGFRYDFPNLFGETEKLPAYSCVAEWNLKSASAQEFKSGLNAFKSLTYVPNLWKPEQLDNQEKRNFPTFWPFIFKNEKFTNTNSVFETTTDSFLRKDSNVLGVNLNKLTDSFSRAALGVFNEQSAVQQNQIQFHSNQFAPTQTNGATGLHETLKKSAPEIKARYRVNYPIPKNTLNEMVRSNFEENSEADPKEESLVSAFESEDRLFSTNRSKEDKTPKSIVICAIIDDGIPFAHKAFRHPEGEFTRVEYCWSQGAVSQNGEEVLFGREFTGSQIDQMLVEHDYDETEVYREGGLLAQPGGAPMPLDRMSSHGAHTLDVLAGSWDEMESKKTDARIIAVDLPPTTTWDTSGFGKDMFVLSAIHYIFNKADALKKSLNLDDPIPLVLNFSYGLSGGPHDGSGLLEVAIDELVSARREMAPTAVVMPSGNLFLNSLHAVLTNRHFTTSKQDNAGKNSLEAELNWVIQPNDGTSSFLEIWLPVGFNKDDFAFKITSPSGEENKISENIDEGKIKIGPTKECVGNSYIQEHRGKRWQILVGLVPTSFRSRDANPSEHVSPPTAPAGTWKIGIEKLTKKRLKSTDGIECWIQRDEDFGQGNTSAKQSYLKDDKNKLYWKDGQLAHTDSVTDGAKVRRFGSFNGLATGKTTLVVGGYVSDTKQASVYSSAGSLRTSSRGRIIPVGSVVDISAVTERTQWLTGVQAAGTRSGVTVTLRGTSAAAPQVARRLAKLFAEIDKSKEINTSVATKTNFSPSDPLDEAGNYLGLLKDVNESSKPINGGIAHRKSKDRVGERLLHKRKAKVLGVLNDTAKS